MSMNTPIGNITQTTPIKNFKELDEMQNEQYLLGIDNNAVGNGSKISLENLINSSISADSDNLITKGTDDRLLVNTPIEIGDLSNLTTTNKSTLVAAINEVDSNIIAEATTRQNTDNNLQSQIDAITAASDVTDIVGTYAELQAYDTTGLPDNSIIKVLQDESRQNETAYYRWVITGGVGTWVLIGEEGPYYTISQSDSKFATQATVGNLSNLATSDKSSVVNAMNELASVLDPTQTADYIKNSKGLESGEISTNASILPWVEEMSHSTFDLSKFTVVGSPTINNQTGIVSSGNWSNYVSTGVPLSTLTNKSWKIKGNFIIDRAVTDNNTIVNLSNDTPTFGSVVIGSASIQFLIKTGDNTDASTEGVKFDFRFTPQIGDIINYEFEYDHSTGTYYGYAEKNGVALGERKSWVSTSTNTQLYQIYRGSSVNIAFRGTGNNNWTLNESIDLKQFSITANGVEVFSGNKTGIDTIKQDFSELSANSSNVNATISTTTGIMSGFDSANDYYKYMVPSYNNKIEFEFGVICGSLPVGHNKYFCYQPSATTASPQIGITPNGTIMTGILGADSGVDSEIPFPLNTLMLFKTVRTEGTDNNRIFFYYRTLTTDWTLIRTSVQSASVSKWSGLNLCLGRGFTDANYWADGTIDLNYFKVYIDDNLTYLPCLNIPYIETSPKFGSKIVNAIYRDRVQDAYEQGYPQRYYTLDEDNGNFTLPCGELYGMIDCKVNLDFSNMNPNQTAKNMIVGWGMPDYSNGIDVSSAISSATAFTAPCDGLIVAFTADGRMDLYIDNVWLADLATTTYNGVNFSFAIPISKGSIYYATAPSHYVTGANKFYPLKGVN